MSRTIHLDTLIPAILAGEPRALARAITQVENETPLAAPLLQALYPATGKARLIGVTGAPGTGKSSLVNALTRHLRQLRFSVGVIAIDPSSPFSRGAVLGDRIRMQDHSGDEGVFIRSMASRGSLGGLARTTVDVIRIMDAAGFQWIIIETVGAGQSEVAIASVAHTTLVVEAPGLGDDIQANKAGILEIADILVVNKADNPAANKTVQTLKAMLDLGHRMQMVAHHGERLLQQDTVKAPDLDFWQIPVLKTVATQHEGLPELYEAILAHQQHLQTTGAGQEREQVRLELELVSRLEAVLLERFLATQPHDRLQAIVNQVVSRQLDPQTAIHQLLEMG